MGQTSAHSLAACMIRPTELPSPLPHSIGTSTRAEELSVSNETPANDRASLGVRILNLLAIIIPFAGCIAAMVLLWGIAFSWLYLAIFGAAYFLTAIGVTVGYHRLFTHKAFETNAAVKGVLGILGSMAVQGPIIEWAATHRSHHQHSDRDHDPHSPNHSGAGFLGILKGVIHAHCGWFIDRDATQDVIRYAPDLVADKVVRRVSKLFPLWVFLGLVAPAAVAFVITGSWVGALLGFVWGGLVRVFFVHHVTWSVNSICHLWGTNPFQSHDHSRNNVVVGVLALGEGWHNNHHAFPTSARHGLRWWEFDASYLIIRAMALFGLARNIRVPSRERIETKRIRKA